VRRAPVPGAQGRQHEHYVVRQDLCDHGKFDNIGGLKPQAPVKSAGVVVGRVGDIKFR
jgi:hypothetical protein